MPQTLAMLTIDGLVGLVATIALHLSGPRMNKKGVSAAVRLHTSRQKQCSVGRDICTMLLSLSTGLDVGVRGTQGVRHQILCHGHWSSRRGVVLIAQVCDQQDVVCSTATACRLGFICT